MRAPSTPPVPSVPSAPDELLARERVCTWGQLLRAGATLSLARSRVASGRWWRPFRGAYADALAPDEAEVYGRAALLLVPHAVLSHGTAAQIWGIRITETVRAKAEITIDRDAPSARPRPGLLIHRAAIADGQRYGPAGLSVLGPARTVVDLARELAPQVGLAVADAFLRAGLTDAAELQAEVEASAGSRGAVRAREVVAMADGRSESVMESLCRWLFANAGLPAPEVQFGYVDRQGRFVGRLDFYWPEAKLAVEFDGWDAHMGRRERFTSDRRRQNLLLADGVLVLRFTGDDLRHRPHEVVAQIWSALQRRTGGIRTAQA